MKRDGLSQAACRRFYITDDSTSTVKDISTAPNPNADPDAHRSHQNTLLTNYDMFGAADNDQVKAKFKVALTQEHQFGLNTDKYGVSTAQVDYTLKEYDLTTRIGRQSRNTGGVIGRFDGAVLSWQQSPDLRWNVLAGSPNWSRFDAPFAAGKTLYGASVDFGKVFGFLDTTLFAIEQFDRNLVDRQAIGAEFRYFDRNKSALGTIDYDVHFQQLNAAIFSGTYTLDDKSVDQHRAGLPEGPVSFELERVAGAALSDPLRHDEVQHATKISDSSRSIARRHSNRPW